MTLFLKVSETRILEFDDVFAMILTFGVTFTIGCILIHTVQVSAKVVKKRFPRKIIKTRSLHNYLLRVRKDHFLNGKFKLRKKDNRLSRILNIRGGVQFSYEEYQLMQKILTCIADHGNYEIIDYQINKMIFRLLKSRFLVYTTEKVIKISPRLLRFIANWGIAEYNKKGVSERVFIPNLLATNNAPLTFTRISLSGIVGLLVSMLWYGLKIAMDKILPYVALVGLVIHLQTGTILSRPCDAEFRTIPSFQNNNKAEVKQISPILDSESKGEVVYHTLPENLHGREVALITPPQDTLILILLTEDKSNPSCGIQEPKPGEFVIPERKLKKRRRQGKTVYFNDFKKNDPVLRHYNEEAYVPQTSPFKDIIKDIIIMD
jgi:hypothetical protein